MSKGRTYRAEVANRIALRLCDALAPHCHDISICGSLRRQRPIVHDIDIVAAPKVIERVVPSYDLFTKIKKEPWWEGYSLMSRMEVESFFDCVPRSQQKTAAYRQDNAYKGMKVIRVRRGRDELAGVPRDWQASVMTFQCQPTESGPLNPPWKDLKIDLYLTSPERFVMVKLIRTGSKDHNIRLATTAKQRGWRLYADGRGLECDGQIQQINNEKELFIKLGLEWLEPKHRQSRQEVFKEQMK